MTLDREVTSPIFLEHVAIGSTGSWSLVGQAALAAPGSDSYKGSGRRGSSGTVNFLFVAIVVTVVFMVI